MEDVQAHPGALAAGAPENLLAGCEKSELKRFN